MIKQGEIEIKTELGCVVVSRRSCGKSDLKVRESTTYFGIFRGNLGEHVASERFTFSHLISLFMGLAAQRWRRDSDAPAMITLQRQPCSGSEIGRH